MREIILTEKCSHCGAQMRIVNCEWECSDCFCDEPETLVVEVKTHQEGTVWL